MKKIMLIFAVISAMLIAGCEYDSPLAAHQDKPIDSSIIGLWERIDEEGEAVDPQETILILEFTQTDYLAKLKSHNLDVYFRGYPIEFNGKTFVQVQLIGTDQGDQDSPVMKKYHLVKYSLDEDILNISILNKEVVGNTKAESKQLRKDFAANIDNPELFIHNIQFRKVD